MDLITLIGIFFASALVLTFIEKFVFKLTNLPVNFVRNMVGIWFIFSGVVKAIDPAGTAIKMEEYFEIFEVAVKPLTPLWKFMIEHALAVSFFMIVLEIYLGIALLLGVWKKSTIWLLILLILFFTFLTGYSAKTGKVTDCGCFGDFIKLAPIQSFYKDIFLTALILIIFFGRKHIKEIFPKIAGRILLVVLTIAAIAFAYRNVYYEPVKDFRAYTVGSSIPDCLTLPPNAKKTITEIIHTYKNNKTQEVKTFKTPPQDWENWTWISREDQVIQKGDEPKCKDFAIMDGNGSDYTQGIFEEEEYVFLIIVPSIHKVSEEGFKRIKTIADSALVDQKYVFILTGSVIADVQEYAKKRGMNYEVYITDATPLKTIMRSNPGLLILKKGVIVGKYHHNNLTTYAELKKEVLK